MTCEEVLERELVELYVADRLHGAEKEGFESHYVDCERCQDALRLGTILKEEFDPDRIRRTSRFARWGRWAIPVGLSAAAGLAMLLLLRDGSPERTVRDLGRVTTLPESPTGLILAAEGSEGDSLLAEGLRAYQEGDHAEAAKELTASIRTGGDTLPAAFYLGASLLAESRFSEAIEAYRNVIASGDTVYESTSRYYLAKALLREGRAEEALESLAPVEGGAGEMGLRASSLADSIAEAAGRRAE